MTYFQSPQAIRDRCKLLFERVLAGESEHSRLDADCVTATITIPAGKCPSTGAGDILAEDPRIAWPGPEKRLEDLDPPELRSDVSPPIQRLSDGMVF